MTTPSTTPATKPEPVRLLGAVITGLTAFVAALTIIFQDQPQVILVIGIVGAVVAAVNVAKDSYVRSQVIPAADVTGYVNDQRQEIAGPAADAPTGTPVDPHLSQLDEWDGVGQPARVEYPDGTEPPTGADGLQQLGRHAEDDTI